MSSIRNSAMAEVIGSRARDGLLALLESAESRRPNLLRVLTYHRVPDPLAFEHHMRHLASRYHVAPMEALLDAIQHDRPLGPRSVMITFDDGYREVGDVAWPILRRLGLPATLFVPTAYPGRPGHTFWWDRLEQAIDDTPRRDLLATPIGRLPLARPGDRAKACSRLKRYLRTLHHDDARQHGEAICRDLDAPPRPVPGVLGWDDLRRLAREGLVIGAHSRNHPVMSRLSAAAARLEILGAQEDLRRELGEAPPIFCYPDGRYDRLVLDALREAGIVVGFTTRRGTNDLRVADPLQLGRINVSRTAGLPVLRARLIHSSVYLNRWRLLFDRQPGLTGDGPVAMLLEKVRSRLVYRSLDAVVTAPLRPQRSVAQYVGSILTPRASNYDRVGSLVKLVDAVLPGTARRAGKLICRPIQLPFPTEKVELLAYGSGATVFVAQAGSSRRVVKFYRRSLGTGPRRLGELLEWFREKYDCIRSWYEEVPGLVWPAEFVLLPGPILGRPAVACVQQYLEGEPTDFFRCLSNGRLEAAMQRSDELRRQVAGFAERTLHVCRTLRRCPDLLGHNNLSIVGRGHEQRLRLIDYGIFDLDAAGRTPAVRGQLDRCLEQIRGLLRSASVQTSAEGIAV